MSDDTIEEVKGTITLGDGTVSEFLIDPTNGWTQWGANTERLGRSVEIMDAMTAGLAEVLT